MPRAALTAFVFLLLGPSAWAQPKGRSAQELLRAMEKIHLGRRDEHPGDIRDKTDALAAFGTRFRSLGLEAVRPLSYYLGDRRRPLRLRVFAAAFLGLIGEPAAFPSLKNRTLDEREDEGLRSAALQSAGSLGLAPSELRPLLDLAAGPSQPASLRREAFSQLAWIGTDDVAGTERAAKSHGPNPHGLELGSVGHALSALGRARSSEAEGALYRLLDYYSKSSSLRPRTLSAITRQRMITGVETRRNFKLISLDELATLTRILAEEKGTSALQAARLLGAMRDTRATPALVSTLKGAKDPAVLAEAAESLAAVGDPRGAEVLREVSRNLLYDERFKALTGGPDPRTFAVRIQKAAETFKEEPESIARAEVLPKEQPQRGPLLVQESRAVSMPFGFEGWPGTGKPILAWSGTVAGLRLRAEPDRGTPVLATVNVAKGNILEFDDSVVITRTPGRVRANTRVLWDAHEMGTFIHLSRLRYHGPAVLRRLEFLPGDQAEVLSYLAEGKCFLRREHIIYLAYCPQDDRTNFTLHRLPDSEWWLHLTITDKTGKTQAGWFYAEQEGIEFLPRW